MSQKNIFITYREENEKGELCYYILQKAHPHFLGILVSSPIESAITNMPLPEYNLWISYAGVLEGRFVPGYKEVEMDIELVFAAMVDWYYEHRIKTNPKKYTKFKIDVNTKPTG